MPFPDLNAPSDTQRGTLVKVAILRDPDGKSANDLLFDLHFAHLVTTDPADLARIDALIPGAGALVQAGAASAQGGGAGRRTRISDSTDVADRHLTVTDPASGQHLCWQRRSEVRPTKLRIVGPAATAIVVLRVRGLDAMDAVRLARCLEAELDVSYEDLKPKLFPQPQGQAGPSGPTPGVPRPVSTAWDGSFGCLVAGSTPTVGGSRVPYIGIVINARDQGDGKVLQVEDALESSVSWVPAADVETCVHVVAQNGEPLADALARYATVAATEGVAYGWRYLVKALGMAYSDGKLAADTNGAWTLTPEIFHAAVDAAADDGRAPRASRREAAEA